MKGLTMNTTNNPLQFFYDNAEYSYGANETPEQGRMRSAEALANAERAGSEAGMTFHWEIDQGSTSADWSDEEPAYEQWCCVCRDAEGKVVSSLCGIDF